MKVFQKVKNISKILKVPNFFSKNLIKIEPTPLESDFFMLSKITTINC